MKNKQYEIIKTIKEVAKEINELNSENVMEWIEDNILEIGKNNNRLIFTLGGPTIYIFIEERFVEGSWGSITEYENCNTTVLEDFLNEHY